MIWTTQANGSQHGIGVKGVYHLHYNFDRWCAYEPEEGQEICRANSEEVCKNDCEQYDLVGLPDLQGRELLELFVRQYHSGAGGCHMEWKSAQALAVAINAMLKETIC
jgi:hypothetical protein